MRITQTYSLPRSYTLHYRSTLKEVADKDKLRLSMTLPKINRGWVLRDGGLYCNKPSALASRSVNREAEFHTLGVS